MSILAETSLEGDLFPELTNPFDTSIIPDVVGAANKMINTNPATAAVAAQGFVGQGNINIDPASGLTFNRRDILRSVRKTIIENNKENEFTKNQTKLT